MPSVITPDQFRDALGRFASGVAIVTTRDAGGTDHGMTVSAFSSLSIDPPLILFCIDHAAAMSPHIAAASHVGVSLLAEGQEALPRRFALKDADRFAGVPVVRAASGVALVPAALVHMDCRVTARHEAGDHTIVVAEVMAVATAPGEPLVYYRGAYGRLLR
jgi:flavin reductase (DIM6/NTAB) family NADH-FMN oxidoreductase RutF